MSVGNTDRAYTIRPLTESDIPRLVEINPTFTAHTVLRVLPHGEAPFVTWTLREEALDIPYEKGSRYDFDIYEQRNIRERFHKQTTLIEVVEDSTSRRLVGILDIEHETWRRAAWIWNFMLDVSARGKGLGRTLHNRAVEWSQRQKLRAILLETQTNNTPACHFYAHLGYELIGINTLFYTNRDMERGEIALFWGYRL